MENYKLYEPRFRTREILRLILNCHLLLTCIIAFFMPIFLGGGRVFFIYSYSMFDVFMSFIDTIDVEALLPSLLWIGGYVFSIVDIIKGIVHVSNTSNMALVSYSAMKKRARLGIIPAAILYTFGAVFLVVIAIISGTGRYSSFIGINILLLVPITMMLIGCIVLYIIIAVKDHRLTVDIIRNTAEIVHEELNGDLQPKQ